MSDLLDCTKYNSVLTITHHDPETRNSVHRPVYDGICAAIEEGIADRDVAAIVITGGGGFFSSGGNIKAMVERLDGGPEVARAGVVHLHQMIRTIRECPKPVIAAVEGGAAGAGFSLALACDMIVAARDAYFSIAYVKIGLTPDGGITASLGQTIPRHLLFELASTGDRVMADRLHQMGLIARLTDPGMALDEAQGMAERYATAPQNSLATIKSLISAARINTFNEQLEQEADAIASAFSGDEAREGVTSFLAKKSPDFKKLR